MPKNIIQQVFNPAGLDLRRSDIVRDPNMATGGNNFIRTHSGHLVKRQGYQIKANNQGGYGLVKYEKKIVEESTSSGWGAFEWGDHAFGSPVLQSTGRIERKLISFDDTPREWASAILTVTYSGSNAATIEVYVDSTAKMRVKLTDNGTEVLDFDCGDGTEGSPTTIASLVTSISAVSNFTASATGDTTVSAAFLDITGSTTITSGGGSQDVGFGYWTDLSMPYSSTWANVSAREPRADFENVSAVSLDGVLFATNGRDEVHKYDGQAFYRAGMPDGNQPVAAVNVTAGNLNGAYTYVMIYKQIDAVGNVVEGAISNASASISPSNEQADITLTNIEDTSGFNTYCAIVDGTQTSTNVATNQEQLTVDDGSGGSHTLNVGDTAYLYDKNTSSYLELEIVAVTGTTITVNSASTLSVDDNQVISNNLRIQVYRTVAGGSALYYLVEEIPNNSFASTQVYTDNTADADLGAEWIEPIKTPAIPPKGKYLGVWNNQLIIAGNLDNPNRIYYSYYSDVVSPESFPSENFIEVGRGPGGVITGLGVVNRNLIVFNEFTTWIAEGNLALDVVRFDPISTEIGCVSDKSIANINNKVMWLSSKGVYMFNGRNLTRASIPLDPLFAPDSNIDFAAAERRAVATIWEDHNRYILFLPVESGVGSDPYANSSSAVYVWDDTLEQWFPWNNINAIGGIVSWDDDTGETLWFQSREDGVNRLYKMNNSFTEYDYVDHTAAVSMEFNSQWVHGGYPTIDKQFINLMIYGMYEGAQLNYTPSGTWTIEVEKNFNPSNVESTLTAVVTETNPYVHKSLRSTKKRAIRFNFKNSELNKQTLLTGYELSYWPYRIEVRR